MILKRSMNDEFKTQALNTSTHRMCTKTFSSVVHFEIERANDLLGLVYVDGPVATSLYVQMLFKAAKHDWSTNVAARDAGVTKSLL